MKSRVRIGFQADFAPFMFDNDGPFGLVIDALEPALAALRGSGSKVDWSALELQRQEDALRSGEVDLLAGLGVTEVRREAGIVFGRPVVRTGGALFQLREAGEPQRITTPTSGPLLQPTREAFPSGQLLEAVDYPDALNHVVEGGADAAALNFHVGWELAERLHPGRFQRAEQPFLVVDLAPAFPSSDSPLLGWFE